MPLFNNRRSNARQWKRPVRRRPQQGQTSGNDAQASGNDGQGDKPNDSNQKDDPIVLTSDESDSSEVEEVAAPTPQKRTASQMGASENAETAKKQAGPSRSNLSAPAADAASAGEGV